LVGNGWHEVFLGSVLRLQSPGEALAVRVVRFPVLFSGDMHLPGEPMTGCVEAGASLAFGGAGACGMLGVQPVGIELGIGDRMIVVIHDDSIVGHGWWSAG